MKFLERIIEAYKSGKNDVEPEISKPGEIYNRKCKIERIKPLGILEKIAYRLGLYLSQRI